MGCPWPRGGSPRGQEAVDPARILTQDTADLPSDREEVQATPDHQESGSIPEHPVKHPGTN